MVVNTSNQKKINLTIDECKLIIDVDYVDHNLTQVYNRKGKDHDENLCLDLVKYIEKKKGIIPPWSITYEEDMIVRPGNVTWLVDTLDSNLDHLGKDTIVEASDVQGAQST